MFENVRRLLRKRKNRVGIIVKPHPPVQMDNAVLREYNLHVTTERENYGHPMFFTTDAINGQLSGKTPSGEKIGGFTFIEKLGPPTRRQINRVVQGRDNSIEDAKDQRIGYPLIIIQQVFPYRDLPKPLEGIGISSLAEEKILAHLIREGLGNHRIRPLIDEEDDGVVRTDRIRQLARRLNVQFDPNNPRNPKTMERIREILEEHTIQTYYELIKRYNENHKTD